MKKIAVGLELTMAASRWRAPCWNGVPDEDGVRSQKAAGRNGLLSMFIYALPGLAQAIRR